MDDEMVTEDVLAKATAAIAGEIPLMSQPPDGVVDLFRGLWLDGTWQTQAEVKELSGEDEEIVARAVNADDSIGFVNAMLSQGVVRIGSLDLAARPVAERLTAINQLLVGEKELLFLRLLTVTFGDVREIAATCMSCRADFTVEFSISEDIKTRKLEDPHRMNYEFKMRDGTIVEYRLVTGADQAEASKRRSATTPEQNTILLSRVVTSVNGKPPLDPLHYARSMNAGDRRKLLDEVNVKQPGPYFQEVKLPCAECGVEATFNPGWADLL